MYVLILPNKYQSIKHYARDVKFRNELFLISQEPLPHETESLHFILSIFVHCLFIDYLNLHLCCGTVCICTCYEQQNYCIVMYSPYKSTLVAGYTSTGGQ